MNNVSTFQHQNETHGGCRRETSFVERIEAIWFTDSSPTNKIEARAAMNKTK